MNRILVPPHPGIFSAYGLAVADVRIDYVRADGAVRADALSRDEFLGRLEELRREAAAEFAVLGHAPETLKYVFAVDARYVGQGYELRVLVDPAEIERDGAAPLIEMFHALHARQYGHSFSQNPVEAISFRLTAIRPRPALHLETPKTAGGDGKGAQTVSLPGASGSYTLYDRNELPAGFAADGPAIVVEPTTSTPVPPGWRLEVLDGGAIMLTRSEG